MLFKIYGPYLFGHCLAWPGRSEVIRRVSTSNVKGCGHAQYFEGTGQISSGTPFCRLNAAFHLATEPRIYAAAKNSVVRPYFDQLASAGFADAKSLTRCVRLLRSHFGCTLDCVNAQGPRADSRGRR